MHNPRPANLRASMYPDAYKKLIIKLGGEAVGRSGAMPPWGDELTEEQINDVVNYLRSIAPANAEK
jgi:cytochrome c oxidase cbb3-type subunit 3